MFVWIELFFLFRQEKLLISGIQCVIFTWNTLDIAAEVFMNEGSNHQLGPPLGNVYTGGKIVPIARVDDKSLLQLYLQLH